MGYIIELKREAKRLDFFKASGSNCLIELDKRGVANLVNFASNKSQVLFSIREKSLESSIAEIFQKEVVIEVENIFRSANHYEFNRFLKLTYKDLCFKIAQFQNYRA